MELRLGGAIAVVVVALLALPAAGSSAADSDPDGGGPSPSGGRFADARSSPSRPATSTRRDERSSSAASTVTNRPALRCTHRCARVPLASAAAEEQNVLRQA